jgi:hypothetical protein
MHVNTLVKLYSNRIELLVVELRQLVCDWLGVAVTLHHG